MAIEPKPTDWADVQTFLAVAKHKSFVRAGQELDIDQHTVAARVRALEGAVGRRLLVRSFAGAIPTNAGIALLSKGDGLREAMALFEAAMRGLEFLPATVRIGAPAGFLHYTIRPALEGRGVQPLSLAPLADPSLALEFVDDPKGADIYIHLMDLGVTPRCGSGHCAERLGVIHFKPFISRRLAQGKSAAARFDDLGADFSLLSIDMYGHFRSMGEWLDVCADAPTVVTYGSTMQMHSAFLEGAGIMVTPAYSHLYEGQCLEMELAYPRMTMALWISTRDDVLREPAARLIFQKLREAFTASPWFGEEISTI